MLRIRLLGRLTVSVDDREIPESAWKTRHARLALGVLVCAAGPVSPRRLAELLWPDRPPERAVVSAQKAVGHLRQAVEPGRKASQCRYVVTRGDDYALVRGPDCWVDTEEFESCVREISFTHPWTPSDWEELLCEGSASAFRARTATIDLKRLEAALCLYRGEFLLADGGDEAVGLDRDRFRELYLRGVEVLCRGYSLTKRPGNAIEWVLKGLAVERSREELYRWWMWAHYSWGNRAEASEVYHKCREALKQELGVTPDPQTERLYLMAIGAGEVENLTPQPPSPQGKGAFTPPLAGEGQGERSVSEAPFVGREAEMVLLEKGLEAMLRGRRSAYAIQGETGIGKSLLAERLGRVAEEQGALFVTGRCDQWLPSFPWDPLCEAVRQIIRALVDQFVDPMPEKAKVALRAVSSELGALVPEMTDRPPIPPGYDRPQLFAGLAELVKHAAACNPLVLLLEDMHWAQPTFLDWLSHALKRLPEESQLMLLMTCRTEEPGGAEFRKWVESPAVKGRVKEIGLGRLKRESVLEYVRETLPPGKGERKGERKGDGVVGQLPMPRRPTAELRDEAVGHRALSYGGPVHAVGDRLARYLWRETEGHPLLLSELWRLLVEGEKAWRRPGGVWDLKRWPLDQRAEEPSVPERLRKAVLLRATNLDEEAMLLLQTASVAGMRFDPEACAVIGEVRAEVAACVETLVAAGFFRPWRGPGSPAEFTHDKIRLAVYSGLSDLRRRYSHLRLAERLEAAGEGSDAALIAEHFLRAGYWERALPHFEKAAEAAQARYSAAEAAWLLGRALDLGGRVKPPEWDSRELSWRLNRGDLLCLCGRYAEAEVELRTALKLAATRGDSATEMNGCQALVRALVVQGKTDAARESALRSLRLAEDAGSPREIMAALLVSGYATHWQGGLEEAFEYYTRSLSLARAHGEKGRAVACLNVLGVNHAQRGWLGKAQECLEEALVLRRELRDSFGLVRSQLNLANVLLLMGKLDDAEEAARAALSLAEEIVFPHAVAVCRLNLGDVYLRRGRPAEAESEYDLAREIFEDAGGGLDCCDAYIGLSRVAAQRCQAEAALLRAESALDLCLDARAPFQEGMARRVLGEAWLVAGEQAGAENELATSVATLERIGARPEAARSRASLARCLAAGGRASEAEKERERAREMFREMGMEWDLAST